MSRVELPIEDKLRQLPDLGELEGAEGLLIAENRMTPRLKSIIELRRRELKQALVVLACLWAMPADAQETIHIGGMHINGAEVTGTPVTIEASAEPGVLAVVTMDNRSVNEARDNGVYPLVLGGLTIQVEFFYNIGPAQGADRITVLVPDGITCKPEDCSVTLIEGFKGTVTLFHWAGM